MGTMFLKAQNTVTTDAGADFLGFANVFDTTADGGAFIFGSGWGVPDLQTLVDTGAGTITLQPNFNTFADNPGDDFWINPTTGEGNKVFEANTFVESTGLVGSELTFTGGVLINDLDPSYVAIAFIKVFNADFSSVKQVDAPLVGGQNFSITYTEVEAEDTTVQYGWQIIGRNANPANEATLGSIVVTDIVLGTNDFDAQSISTFPNPVASNWNVQSKDAITSIKMFNILGQQVVDVAPDSTTFNQDLSSFTSGIYLATVTTEKGSKTIKIIKN